MLHDKVSIGLQAGGIIGFGGYYGVNANYYINSKYYRGWNIGLDLLRGVADDDDSSETENLVLFSLGYTF